MNQLEEQTVTTLLQRISTLVAQRQHLRRVEAVAAQLEENRLEIVNCQRELNRAVIEVHRPHRPASAV